MVQFVDAWLGLYAAPDLDGDAPPDRRAGQGLIEYALLIGIISLTLVTVLPSIGGKVLAKFQAFDTALNP